MSAAYKKLIESLKKKQYAPVYLIDGEEPYYLDAVTQYFEDDILLPHERDFNLMVLYGKDSEWPDVMNACRRFPMFAERQVVILKDAAAMRSLAELTAYLEQPSPTTIFLIEYRGKKADGRSKLTTTAKKTGVYFTSEKMKDDALPGWIQSYGEDHGFRIAEASAQTLAAALGNDLQKIANEIAKVRINAPEAAELSADLIHKYIGISREYNLFQFPEALTGGNKDQLYKMLMYFVNNTRNAPMPLLVATFYSHFQKLYLQQYAGSKSDGELATLLGLPEKDAWKVKNYRGKSRFSLRQIEACLTTLGDYNTEALGVGGSKGDAALLKELVGKMEGILS